MFKNSTFDMEKAGSSSTLLIKLPDKLWLGKISRDFPYHHFQISSFMPINQEPAIGNSLIKITGRSPKRVLEKILSNSCGNYTEYFLELNLTEHTSMLFIKRQRNWDFMTAHVV